jgi:hypothetical protein
MDYSIIPYDHGLTRPQIELFFEHWWFQIREPILAPFCFCFNPGSSRAIPSSRPIALEILNAW